MPSDTIPQVEYSNSIKITRECLESDLYKLIEAKKRCFEYELQYAMSGRNYRRYRRGQNRCPMCGLKHAE